MLICNIRISPQGKIVPHRKLEWQREQPKEEVIDDEAPYGDGREPNFAGFVKSVLRGRKLQVCI